VRIFERKTAQFYTTRREIRITELPNVSNGTQTGEKPCKNSFLNMSPLL